MSTRGARDVAWGAWRCVPLLGCIGLFAVQGAHAEVERGDPLSADELARLARGELVERVVREQRRGLELTGGTSWQVIDAKPEVVWQALLDTTHYHKMIPRALEARLVETAGDVRTIFMRQGVGLFQTTYYLKVRVDEARRDIVFAVDDSRPHQLKAGWGFYSVRPYKQGRALLMYGLRADLGSGLVKFVLRSTIEDWMLKVPWLVKRFVEGSGRWIYR